MATFTGGKWYVGKFGTVTSDNGTHIADVSGEEPEDVCNANLIAAAPKMYALLKQMESSNDLLFGVYKDAVRELTREIHTIL